jgi:dienelactone hydrolase
MAIPARYAMVVAVACSAPPVSHAPPAAPLPPPPAAKVRGARHIEFPSPDDDLSHGAATLIDAYLFVPDTAGPHAAVILLHGCTGMFGPDGDLTPRERDWADRLVAAGYVVMLPDSFGPRHVAETCSRDPDPVRPGFERVRDVSGAIAFLAARVDIDASRIALLGWSHGGSTVLAAVAAREKFKPSGFARDPRVAIAFYPGCAKTLERKDWAPPVAPLHVLIGAADDWTPAKPCQELVDLARAKGGSADIAVYPGARHDFDEPELAVQTVHDVAGTPTHVATIGGDPVARANAIVRVERILRDALHDDR